MHALTTEWIAKVEADLATLGREVRARTRPNYDAACFHAQQAAEKYLKAILQERGATVSRAHNLIALLELVTPHHPALERCRPQLILLDRFAVQYRYPGASADKNEARRASAAVRDVRSHVRAMLGLA